MSSGNSCGVSASGGFFDRSSFIWKNFAATSVDLYSETDVLYTERQDGVIVFQTIDVRRSGCSANFVSADGYLLTAGHCALVNNLFQFDDGEGLTVTEERVPLPPPDEIVRVNRMYAQVFDINGVAGTNAMYECEILGIDGSNDTALLRINPATPYNVAQGLAPLTTQPFLRWGDSAAYAPGNLVYNIGSPAYEQRSRAMRRGAVEANQWVTPGNLVQFENVVFDKAGAAGTSGSSILDQDGKIIGIVSWAYTGGDLHASQQCVSQRTAQPIAEQFEQWGRTGSASKVIEIPDAVGTYVKYSKGWLGAYIEPVTGDTIVSLPETNGLHLPQELQNAFIFTNGLSLGYPPVYTDSLSGIIWDWFFTYGVCYPPPSAVPFTCYFVVTHIDDVAIGSYAPAQFATLPVLHTKTAGDYVKLTYRSLDPSNGKYLPAETIDVRLEPFPASLERLTFAYPTPLSADARKHLDAIDRSDVEARRKYLRSLAAEHDAASSKDPVVTVRHKKPQSPAPSPPREVQDDRTPRVVCDNCTLRRYEGTQWGGV